MKREKSLSVRLRVMLAATFVSNIGSAMSVLALGKIFYDKTGDLSGFAWVFAFEQLVQVIGLYCAGPLSDRLNPRKLAVTADMVRGVFFVLSAILIITTQNPLYALTSVLVGGFLKPFHRAAIFRWLPLIVNDKELFKLNSAYGSAVQAGGLLGSGIAGALMTILPASYLILIDGGSYFLSGAILLVLFGSVQVGQETGRSQKRSLQTILGIADWHHFLAMLKDRFDLCSIIVFNAFDYVVAGVFNIFLIPYVALVLKASPLYISVVDAFFAIGSLLLVYSQRYIDFDSNSKRVLSAGYALMAVGFMGLGAGKNIGWACLATLLIGYGQRLVFTCNTSNLQLATPATFRGRTAVLRLAVAGIVSAIIVAPTATLLKQNIELGLFSFAGAVAAVWGFYIISKLRLNQLNATHTPH